MKKRVIYIILFLLIVLGINGYIWNCHMENNYIADFCMELETNQENEIQLFYSSNGEFTEENSEKERCEPSQVKKIKFEFDAKKKFMRLDLGNIPDVIKIYSLNIEFRNNELNMDFEKIVSSNEISGIESCSIQDGTMIVKTNSEDPYIVLKTEELGISQTIEGIVTQDNKIIKILAMIIVNIILIVCYRFRRLVYSFVCEIMSSKKLIYNLSKNDFKTRYAGSYLGIIWAFVQPIITILVYWFVFQVGFRTGTIDDFPFVLWLMCGMIPWFFFSESWNATTNCLVEYSYLVKKVVFKINTLPIVKMGSALFVHVFFVMLLLIAFILHGYWPSIYAIQVLYYSVAMCFLVLGLSYITCSVLVFFKDLGQIINIVLQVGMWMTPIMWNYQMMSEKYYWILKINPVYYIVKGYRDALINKVWFWNDGIYTIYFWGVSLVLFLIGVKMFNNLKIHFADVL